MENFDGFRHTAFADRTVTGAAADYVIPQPPSISGLGANVNVTADELELAAPSTNVDQVYVALEGTATTASKPIAPGETKRFSGTGRTKLSALAASGSQTLKITGFYR